MAGCDIPGVVGGDPTEIRIVSTCTCETRRILVSGEDAAEGVTRLDLDCTVHGFPGDRWRASPLERFALRLGGRKERPREVAERLIAATKGGMLGRVYYERGEPVVVLARWKGAGPRNVLIRRADGSKAVRPFRGLRREPPAA